MSIPTKFKTQSEFFKYLHDHEEEFELALDYYEYDLNDCESGWVIYLHRPSGRYFYEEQSCNDAFVSEVELIAELTYDSNHDLQKDGAYLSELFDCTYCGEQVNDDGIKYLWFTEIEEIY